VSHHGVLLLAAFVALTAASRAAADRISEMSLTERCVYKARLSVAGYHYYRQGRARDALVIHWHGDETRNEIDFVNRTLDQAYSAIAELERGTPQARVSEQSFGDRVYEACMRGTNP
jgi:hypothetical protein